jgi:hypothetical protein
MVDWLAGNRVRGLSTERTTTTGFNDGFTGVGGWTELGRTTLGSAGDTITVSSLADKRYYMVLTSDINSGSTQNTPRLGSTSADSGSNYAVRFSRDGAADFAQASQTQLGGTQAGSFPKFSCMYIANLSAKEKLTILHEVLQNTAGAANAPQRTEQVGKWVNTSNPIDVIQGFNADSGSFNTGSECVVLGWDPADTHTTNFWEELASVELGSANNTLSSGTFTAKKYLWVQYYVPSSTGSADNYIIKVGNSTIDTGSNYCQRYSIDGGTDGTQINQSYIRLSWNYAFGSEWMFANQFIINNASNEKLMMSHSNRNDVSGAGTAPHRHEIVGKWTNTSNQINIIDLLHQNGASTLGAGTIMKVWGSD